MDTDYLNRRVKTIVEERLVKVTPEVKSILPPILQGEIEFFTFLTARYFALFFVDGTEKERIASLRKKNIQPFPYLIKPEGTAEGSAFRFEKSRFIWIDSCKVENMFCFSLGEDSTIILSNHTQVVNTKELGNYQYLVRLAYIISFGEEITLDNFYGSLEDLIAYSLKSWACTK
jgi:hypothetical protein